MIRPWLGHPRALAWDSPKGQIGNTRAPPRRRHTQRAIAQSFVVWINKVKQIWKAERMGYNVYKSIYIDTMLHFRAARARKNLNQQRIQKFDFASIYFEYGRCQSKKQVHGRKLQSIWRRMRQTATLYDFSFCHRSIFKKVPKKSKFRTLNPLFSKTARWNNLKF